MSQNPIVAFAALVSTIADIKEGPESSFYLALMGQVDLHTFQHLLATAVKMGICHVKGNYVTFTQPPEGSKGALLLAELARIMAPA